jgi:pyruvate,water dikinase
MRAFWSGILEEGWPAFADASKMKGFIGINAMNSSRNKEKKDWSKDSLAVIGETYMMLSMRMGYHYTTFEAVCTEEISKNFIRMQYKEGGASLDRRIRRIRLIIDILTRMGFENNSHQDFLNTIISYKDQAAIEERLRLLGRLTMMTKQLDMALSSDDITDWYTRDFMKRLGLETKKPE